MNPASLIAGIPWDFETFPEYLGSIARRGTMLNFAAYIGHTPLRLYVMGDEAVGREATADEIDKMAALVAEAMDAGAAGFSTSFAADPPRRRRPAHPQPVGRPGRARRAVPGRRRRRAGASWPSTAATASASATPTTWRSASACRSRSPPCSRRPTVPT